VVPDDEGASVSVYISPSPALSVSFRTRAYPAGSAPQSVSAGDATGDGVPDLVSFANTPNLLVNDGHGRFSASRELGGVEQPGLLADLDGDGRLDFAGARYDEKVTVRRGAGDGTFGSKRVYPAGYGARDIEAADLNGDGRLDLALAVTGDATSSPPRPGGAVVLIATPDGGFAAPRRPIVTEQGAKSVAIADLNRDGRLDLLAANPALRVALGHGDGTFSETHAIYSAGYDGGLAVGDFDGDGAADAVVTDRLPNRGVTVLRGDGAGGFGDPRTYDSPAGPLGVATADFNVDGHLDLAVAGFDDATVGVLVNRGDGTFGAPFDFRVEANPGSLAVADFNRDGRPDIATEDAQFDRVWVLLNRGPG